MILIADTEQPQGTADRGSILCVNHEIFRLDIRVAYIYMQQHLQEPEAPT